MLKFLKKLLKPPVNVLNLDFDINYELVSKYRSRCQKAISDHSHHIMVCAKKFAGVEIDDKKEDFYPCQEHMDVYEILYAIVSEMFGEKDLAFGDFMSRMDILETSIKSFSSTEFHKNLMGYCRSVDWSIFPKGYVTNAQKNDELRIAMSTIDEVISGNSFFPDDTLASMSWVSFYEYFIERAHDLNNKLFSRQLFNTAPEKMLALGLMSRKLGVMSNLPMYVIGEIENDKEISKSLERMLELIYKERYGNEY